MGILIGDKDSYSEEYFNKTSKQEAIQKAYGEYWTLFEQYIDEDGWIYTKECPYLLDAIFEQNTGKEIEFQKSFGKSGDNPYWLTRGSRWRPSELS